MGSGGGAAVGSCVSSLGGASILSQACCLGTGWGMGTRLSQPRGETQACRKHKRCYQGLCICL